MTRSRARQLVRDDTHLGGRVGAMIARERSVRGLTIEELARRAALSTGLLSQLERGIGNPSLASLVAIAGALQMPIGAFFEGASDTDGLVVHPHTRKHLVLSDHNLTYELLVPDLQGSLAMLLVELPAEFTNEARPFVHTGEEVVYVLEGRLEAHIGDRSAQLERGDSMRFASNVPHWYRTFQAKVVAVTAQTPPSF